MEKTQQARIRRLQDTLVVAGTGVIAFSVWSMTKTILFMALSGDERINQLFSINDEVPMILLYIVIGIAFLIDLSVRAFVGLSARSEGHGKKKSPFYLVVAVIAGILNAISAATTALGMSVNFSFMDAVITVLIELTAAAAMGLVVYSSVCLRRLNKSAG